MNFSALASLPIFLAGGGKGFVPPSLEGEFNPPAFLFEGTPFEMNRIVMARMIAALFIAFILIWYARRKKLVPNRRLAAVEALLDFSKVQIGEEILGKDHAHRYQPLIMTIFFGTFFMNITGVIPGLQIAGTSLVGMPLIFALFAYFGFIFAGVRARGGLRFFKEQLFPSGVPWPIYFIMTPIEFLSTFVLRPVTLTLRLLMNLVAGHLILALTFVGTHYLYFTLSGVLGGVAGTVTLIGGIAFMCFEIFVAALQAYIFAMLTASYISLSISEH
ncbi:F0F1 ATP synthase subunit A [Trueperella pecoris]|uniref:F0F1 ATP synthase subunit A n=1 Tax=Trueperella pecoris TaxID=2733571 RepID=UPI0018D4563B|nr:F0F1 ATP synthase subunit A [Trueperella pecoris]